MNQLNISFIKRLLTISFISFVFIGFSTLNNDDDEPLANFKISFEVNESNDIDLTCKKGCAWESLTYHCTDLQCNIKLNYYGMVLSSSSDETKFEISVDHDNDNLNLTCVKGCAWKSLSIGNLIPGSTLFVDYYGGNIE